MPKGKSKGDQGCKNSKGNKGKGLGVMDHGQFQTLGATDWGNYNSFGNYNIPLMQVIKSDPEQLPAPLPTAVAYPTMKPKPLTKLVSNAADQPICPQEFM